MRLVVTTVGPCAHSMLLHRTANRLALHVCSFFNLFKATESWVQDCNVQECSPNGPLSSRIDHAVLLKFGRQLLLPTWFWVGATGHLGIQRALYSLNVPAGTWALAFGLPVKLSTVDFKPRLICLAHSKADLPQVRLVHLAETTAAARFLSQAGMISAQHQMQASCRSSFTKAFTPAKTSSKALRNRCLARASVQPICCSTESQPQQQLSKRTLLSAVALSAAAAAVKPE